ncbi:MAG: hypothetical protein S4CHLAM123_08040 [Chlamydiales bacterium]|nr:hypothetical protein [Chlamydiales bacterium]
MQIIYPDTPVVRSLSDHPETWNALYDQFIETFGRRVRSVQSYYLFFEYLGFTKKQLEIPSSLIQPQFDDLTILMAIDPKKGVSEEEIGILDKHLKKIESDIVSYVKKKLLSMKTIFDSLIEERMRRTSTFKAAQELIDSLFGSMLSLIDQDYATFMQHATTYLAWDIFCGIHPLDLSLEAIRQRQLGYWMQTWEQGIKLPFGKIIDDQSSYYKMEFASRFKEFEDMVDSEMHTYLILGYEIDNQVHPIQCLTYPPKDLQALSKRNELALGTVMNIQKTLKKDMLSFPGKIYSIDKSTHKFLEINEPMFLLSS